MSLLEVSGLGVQTTSGLQIVDDVNFSVDAGQLLAVVGESGSGKTTTALSLIGHARPGTRITQGSIEVNGTSILKLGSRQMRALRGRQVSYVPQDPTASLSPRQRIGAQVAEVLRIHGEDKSRVGGRVGELFEQVDLPIDRSFLRRYPFELSGGQQQRVLIAMALAWRPALVVLDEPTTGLDVMTQSRVLDLLRQLRKDSTAAFVYITHDLAVVDGLADKVVVMYAGRIVESGTCEEVFDRPGHPYTTVLLSSVPRLSVRLKLKGQEASAPPPGKWPAGCAFSPRCARSTDRCVEQFPDPVPLGRGQLARCWHPLGRDEAVELQLQPISAAADTSRQTPLLEVRGLVASYGHGAGRHEVLHGVSASLAPGECLALVGQSGSGKSTLGRCVAGLHHSDSGAVLLSGEHLPDRPAARSAQQRQAIQLVFQNPDRSLNPAQKVANIVGRPLRLFEGATARDARRQVVELLDRVRLPASYLDRYPRQLSGGEKQRVAIARALAAAPKILVSDEITSALDVSIQAAIVELLNELRADGLAILFITHNLALVNSIADHVVVLEQGEVREQGDTAQVIGQPQHPYTRRLLAAAPEMSSYRRADRGSEQEPVIDCAG